MPFSESVRNHSQKLYPHHHHRAGPDLAPAGACDTGHVRHVDGHRVGAGAVVRAVVHREGEGRIGVAVRIARGREGEHVSVDLGLGDDGVRQDRRGAGVVIVEAEVVRRRRGVGGGGAHSNQQTARPGDAATANQPQSDGRARGCPGRDLQRKHMRRDVMQFSPRETHAAYGVFLIKV